MESPALFYESYLEALRDDVMALGGPKVVGPWFWPETEKSVEAARNALNDCLNAARRERLTDAQERLIMRRAREVRGFSAAIYYLCDEAGFERPKAINPEDEQAKLMRDFNRNVENLHKLAERIQQNGGPAALKVVK